MGAEATKTRTDEVHDQLRADILSGRFQPAERLKFTPLCKRYDASVGLIREVLSRLAEQGLVQAQPNVGFAVTGISIEDLQDLTQLRADIEGLALRRSIERAELSWRAQLVSAHYTLEQTPRRDPSDPARISDDWERAHTAFHDVLLVASGSPRLYSIACSLRQSAELYRRWSLPLGEKDGERDVAAEHRRIFEHAVAGHADEAVESLADHICTTTRLIVDSHGTRSSSNAEATA